MMSLNIALFPPNCEWAPTKFSIKLSMKHLKCYFLITKVNHLVSESIYIHLNPSLYHRWCECHLDLYCGQEEHVCGNLQLRKGLLWLRRLHLHRILNTHLPECPDVEQNRVVGTNGPVQIKGGGGDPVIARTWASVGKKKIFLWFWKLLKYRRSFLNLAFRF